VIWLVLAYVLIEAANSANWLNWMRVECPQVEGGMAACLSGNAMVRMSLALALTHLLIFLTALPKNNFSA